MPDDVKHGLARDERWKLLSEHVDWVNAEKRIVWQRYSAQIAVNTLFLAAFSFVFSSINNDVILLILSIIGVVIAILWILQTSYGWDLQNKRLEIVSEIQSSLSEDSYQMWPLAFKPGGRQQRSGDPIRRFALILAYLFIFVYFLLGIYIVLKMHGIK